VVTRELEMTRLYREGVPRIVKQLGIFCFVTFTWIFFRGQTWEGSWRILHEIGAGRWIDPRMPVLMLAMIGAVWLYQLLFDAEGRGRRFLDSAPVRFGLAAAMVAYLAIVAQPSSEAFIYFQF
jgi:hypothetical protein